MRKVAKSRAAATVSATASLPVTAVRDVSAALNGLLADMLVLCLKTKNFQWHASGPHFRDYSRLLSDQSGQIFATCDAIAQRVRKLGGTTLRSVGHISRLQRISDNDSEYVTPQDMLLELHDDNTRLAEFMRDAYWLCDEHRDIASASALESWIDQAEERIWVLNEVVQPG